MTAQLTYKILMVVTFILIVLPMAKPNFFSHKKTMVLNGFTFLVLLPLLIGFLAYFILEKEGFFGEFKTHVSITVGVLFFFVFLYILPKIIEAERKENRYVDVSEWNNEIENKKRNKSKPAIKLRPTKRK